VKNKAKRKRAVSESGSSDGKEEPDAAAGGAGGDLSVKDILGEVSSDEDAEEKEKEDERSPRRGDDSDDMRSPKRGDEEVRRCTVSQAYFALHKTLHKVQDC
jgi:hypothetical protein